MVRPRYGTPAHLEVCIRHQLVHAGQCGVCQPGVAQRQRAAQHVEQLRGRAAGRTLIVVVDRSIAAAAGAGAGKRPHCTATIAKTIHSRGGRTWLVTSGGKGTLSRLPGLPNSATPSSSAVSAGAWFVGQPWAMHQAASVVAAAGGGSSSTAPAPAPAPAAKQQQQSVRARRGKVAAAAAAARCGRAPSSLSAASRTSLAACPRPLVSCASVDSWFSTKTSSETAEASRRGGCAAAAAADAAMAAPGRGPLRCGVQAG